jgi:hypothetical protein
MENNYAVCASLPVEDKYLTLRKENKCGLTELWTLQKNIQENVYGYNMSDYQKDNSKLLSFLHMNKHAIIDEMHEMLNALGGHSLNMGDGSFWKPWKKNHKIVMDNSFENLSNEDKLEVHYEIIDQLHFILNICIALDLTPDKIVNLYIAKNKENIKRQERGY